MIVWLRYFLGWLCSAFCTRQDPSSKPCPASAVARSACQTTTTPTHRIAEAVLGCVAMAVVPLERAAYSGDAKNCCRLASGWIPESGTATALRWRKMALASRLRVCADSHHPLRWVSQWQSGNQSRFAISSTSRRHDVGGCSSSPGAPSVLSTQPLRTREYSRLLRQLTVVPVRLNFAVRKSQSVAWIRITPLVQR